MPGETPTPMSEAPKAALGYNEKGEFGDIAVAPEVTAKGPRNLKEAAGLDAADIPAMAEVDKPAPEFDPGETVQATPEQRADAAEQAAWNRYADMVDDMKDRQN